MQSRARPQALYTGRPLTVWQEARMRAGISQRDLARRLGVGYCVFGKWERGIREPPAGVRTRWQAELGLTQQAERGDELPET